MPAFIENTDTNTLDSFVRQAVSEKVSLIVSDADAIHARAKAAGAEMLFDIEDKPYGGRGFMCRDPQGHIWNVGTYDPWQPK